MLKKKKLRMVGMAKKIAKVVFYNFSLYRYP